MTTKQIETREREINDAIKLRNGGTLAGYYAVTTTEERQELEELKARRMVNSIVTYGGLYVGEYDRARYFTSEDKILGKEKVDEIIADQIEFFRNHAKVHSGVYTDSEGCVYNSIEWN